MSEAIAAAREVAVSLPDGRRLQAYEAGDPTGELVVVHHGTPCSGLLANTWVRDAEQRGIRLVGFDRPGYAGSDRHPGRRVADVVADTAALADALGVERFRTWGVSGGGPHALACAALLPDRVVAATSLAGVAPYGAEGLEWLGGMGEDNVEEFRAAVGGEEPLREYLAEQRAQLLSTTPETLREAMVSLLPEVDQAVCTGEQAEFLHAWITTGLRSTYDGWLDDDLAFVADWGFELAEIGVPVLLMQGRQDLMVPYAHGEWLARHLPGADVVLSDADGHLTLLSEIGRTHAWLLEQH